MKSKDYIKELRIKTGMTRQEFADYFGIPRGTIRNWEQGVSEPPDYVIIMIEKILKHEAKIHIYNGTYMNVTYYWVKDSNGFHLYILANKDSLELVLYPAVYVQDYDFFFKSDAEIRIEDYLQKCEVNKFYEKLYTDA